MSGLRGGARDDPRARALRRGAWAFFGLSSTLLVIGLWLSLLNWSTQADTDWGLATGSLAQALFTTGMFSFSIVGILVAGHQPRNPIGWILLAIGFLWQLSAVTAGYEKYGLTTNPGALPGPEYVLALSQWLWLPAIGLIGIYLVLLFPNGRLPSARWRPFAWVAALGLALPALAITLGTKTFAEVGHPELENPLAVDSPLIDVLAVASPLIPACIVGAALGMILRYRRSRGVERLQLKWLAAAVAATALLYGIAMAVSFPYWARGDTELPTWVGVIQEISVYSFVLIPIAVGIAIRRHRLYEIDAVINRTLVYGVLTAILASSYVGLVFGLQALLGPFTADSDLAVAGSTLAVAAMFRPVGNGVQRFIDQRFYRRKFNAQRTLEDFSGRLRDEVELESLSSQLVGVVTQTMQPAHASLWLRHAGTPVDSAPVTILERKGSTSHS